MRSRLDNKGGVLAVEFLLALSLTALLATSAFAAQSTPPAGTQGRGGVSAVTQATPLAGTQGRGGADVAVQTTPAAGTAGRGGVASAPPASTSGLALAGGSAAGKVGTVAGSSVSTPFGGTGFVGRGRVPAAIAGSASPVWIPAGVTLAAFLLGIFAFWALGRSSRRRGETASVTSIRATSAQAESQQTGRKAA
jgi:hypothetical protein